MRKAAKPASRRTKRPTPTATVVQRAMRSTARKTAKAPPPEPESYTQPLPIRITRTQSEALTAKSRSTGVPVQELIRRSIDFMLDTKKPHEVPERTR